MALPRSRKPFAVSRRGGSSPSLSANRGIQACPPSGRPVNSRSYADVAQLVEHLLGKQEVTSSNLVVSSSTALRWGVARLAIGRNDAAVNKRTSERLWNALGLKQFASAVVVHSGIKSLKWKLSLPRSLLYAGLAQLGRASALQAEGHRFDPCIPHQGL